MIPPNTILQNRYRITRKLGEGGMGTVYEALDQRVNCLVALKETLAANEGEARRAFEHEASLLANLRHQALPKVMDYFSEGDGDFLVMEFIPGYDLAEMLELRGSPFPQSQVLRWADDLLKVLEYLHRQQPPVLHRDIKPSNLKLTKQGEIFLLDFGLSKGTTGQMPTLQTSRSVRGYTPIYAPLEQIHGQGTDPRSDLYSLGATLYHLLTNVAPVDAPTRFHILEDEKPDPLKPITELNPQASANVAEVIHQAMAISRKQRPASAAEMRKALRAAAEEDERSAVEEEYRRAEEKRKQRDEESQRKDEEAARRIEEERQLQEAETRRRQQQQEARQKEEAERLREEEEARLRAEEAKRAEEERQRREEAERLRREAEEAAERERAALEAERKRAAEVEREREEREAEERRRADVQKTIAARTVRSREQSSAEESKPQPGIKTWKAPPPDRFTGDLSSAATSAASISKQTPGSGKRTIAIVGVILAFAIVGTIIFFLSRGTSTGNQNSGETEQQSSQKQTGQTAGNTPAAPEGMVYVPGGTFKMGRDDGDEYERPAHHVTVKPFFIDIYEVTNEDYQKFVQATGHRPPSTWTNGANRTYPAELARRPVTGVNWQDANDYAKWAGKRLPTEEEWEFAARGTDGRLYPWGNSWQSGMANAGGASTSLADVGSYRGASPFGAYDMVGNAWEWTSSKMIPYPGGTLPIKVSDEFKVIRGGTYESNRNQATTTYRRGWSATNASDYSYTGFRLVQDVGR